MPSNEQDLPLIAAVKDRKPQEVERLLESGEDPNAKSSPRDLSALHWAAYRGEVASARLLIEAGADVDAHNNPKQQAPLHVVRDAEVAQLLLNAGANPDLKDRRGNTPLVAAFVQPTKVHSAEEISQIAHHLIDADADVNAIASDGRTALHLAIWAGLRHVVERMVAEGADVSTGSKSLGTPLHQAASMGNAELIDVLISAGAPVNSTDGPRGWTPLHEAVRHEDTEPAKRLIDAGADVNLRDETGTAPLALAHTDTMRQLLIDAGASPTES